MPPKMTAKMTANPIQPARYRAGKPTGADSESSESENDNEVSAKKKQQPTAAAPSAPRRTGAGRVIAPGALTQALREPKYDEDEKRKAHEAIERKATEEGFVTESEDEEESDREEENDSDDDDDDDDEGSSSEDDMPTRKITLPKFMTRAQRERTAKAQNSGCRDTDSTKKKGEEEGEEVEEDAEEIEAKERQAQVDALVEEQLRKQAASRVVSKKQWEDSNELAAAAAAAAAGDGDEVVGDVNTDDDVNPEAEYAAWKLRELKRIKRQREQIEERERELAEIERRRNLTEEERQAEDEVHLAKQKEEKDSRGQAGFMQKYYHKGAFYQEETKAEGLDKRDLMGAHYVDEIRNREMLPKSLQMRDMTKLGRKGASKYRDLRSEDTGRWGVLDDNRNQQRNGGWDRDRDRDRGRDRLGYMGAEDNSGGGGNEHDAKGANAMPLGERKKHIDRDRRRSRSRSTRRERNKRREGDDHVHDWRKRSPSGYEHNSDKRRRVET
ncbi:microfibrillar-associated protein [Grosmannia clavigera kw1407]|uniref:Microfibrillar-associated protein n=1 Tax=Grosmannia clavigera (strain kw1407 / UAMH 11150) TaxID=655863 RepID=F0XNY9_GROCL|nr:microfibrillar-associated protein [Grosmannia clavigera kw1407]EFX00481.1 microfibrillar-associated protein [Grosmannia clavigera kw1407]